MNCTIRFLLLVTALLVAGCANQAKTPQPTLILHNAFLIDGTGAAPSENVSIALRDDKILAIFPTKTAPEFNGIPSIDVQGRSVLPGLINGHVHLTPNPKRENSLGAMLQNGVTSVRDLGGNAELLSTLSGRKGDLPDFYYSATFFGPGFMADPRVARVSSGFEPGNAPWMRQITPDSDLAGAVSEAKASGATGLKLYASLPPETIAKIVQEAQKQNIMVWSHSVIFPATPDQVVAAQVDQLVHAKGLVALGAGDVPDNFMQGIRQWVPNVDYASIDPRAPAFQKLYAEMVSMNTILEPALVADGGPPISRRPLAAWQAAQRDWACGATAAAHEAGVMISAGTDFFGKPGLLFVELERLTDCGLSPLAAIQAATLNTAKAIGIEDRTGSVEPGKLADLLVVDGTPVDNISALRKTVLVIKSGNIVRNELTPGTNR